MTDHLPECPWADRGYAFPCICDRLRACEARLEDEWLHRCDSAWMRGHDTDFLIGALRGEHGTSSN